VDQAQTELTRGQEHLLQSENGPWSGNWRQGVAHSIRNPLTSVNMRLFSLKRSLAMSDSQQEDFQVIAEEIRHIDSIVRNFLEFSRPPKLKMQRISPSDVVDNALVLLRHRLESYEVDVKLVRRTATRFGPIGPIERGPGQLVLKVMVGGAILSGKWGLLGARWSLG
jgi:phosphoglycerate-specific signal transduction histidine kinase